MVSAIRFLPLALVLACAAPQESPRRDPTRRVHFARLSAGEQDVADLARLRGVLQTNNPEVRLRYYDALTGLEPGQVPRVVFVQRSFGARASVAADGAQPAESELAVGDLVLLRPGERLSVEGGAAGLVFTLLPELPAELPSFVRPDHDPRITDQPGGCAEEDDAYRRICLTWLSEKGPYVYHGINAHRVRIRDSFTHYHPREGGWDELYLVQSAQPGARLYYSELVERIELLGRADRVMTATREEASTLISERPLAAGDLVYMPAGTAHRGFGDFVVQVIALPGFRPGGEVGLDVSIREINRRLGLPRDELLPYNASAAAAASPAIRS